MLVDLEVVNLDRDLTLYQVLNSLQGTTELIHLLVLTDYIEVNEAVTFGLGNVVEQICIDVQVFEDRLVEENETVSVFVTTDDLSILLLNTQVEILIINTDGKFSFSSKCRVLEYPTIIVVAMFSFDPMLSTFDINESSGETSVCVELANEVDLGRDITLELAVFADRTADLNDINATTLTYEFSSGSRSGDVLCNTIGITIDGVVENREEFSVELIANHPSEDIVITQPSAVLSIDDSPFDCKLHCSLH